MILGNFFICLDKNMPLIPISFPHTYVLQIDSAHIIHNLPSENKNIFSFLFAFYNIYKNLWELIKSKYHFHLMLSPFGNLIQPTNLADKTFLMKKKYFLSSKAQSQTSQKG